MMVEVTIADYSDGPAYSRLAWSKGWQPPHAVLYSSKEAGGELSQWLCHDD